MSIRITLLFEFVYHICVVISNYRRTGRHKDAYLLDFYTHHVTIAASWNFQSCFVTTSVWQYIDIMRSIGGICYSCSSTYWFLVGPALNRIKTFFVMHLFFFVAILNSSYGRYLKSARDFSEKLSICPL